MTRELSIQDVASIIERVPDLSGMTLVGGQALNYWAETLGIADAIDHCVSNVLCCVREVMCYASFRNSAGP